MKKFTENINEKSNHYANNAILKNELYNIIDECLFAKIDNKDSVNVSIIGKDELIIELLKVIDNDSIKTQIDVLKNGHVIIEDEIKEVTLSDLINEALEGGNFDTTIRV